jgi:hypothetical protein
MVKQAEKERKRNPLLPVFGLLLAAGLFVLAYVIAGEVIKMPQVKSVVLGMKNTAQLIFGFAIWLGLLAISFFLVAVLVGKDPESTKGIPLPTRERDIKKRRR